MADIARPSAGISKNTATKPASMATTMPANSMPPIQLKSRLLVTT
jgi:hypothetical protein